MNITCKRRVESSNHIQNQIIYAFWPQLFVCQNSQPVKPSSNGCSKHSGYKHRSLRNPDQYILHCNQNSLKKHTLTLKFLWIDWLYFFFPLGPTETSVECYKWIFYMCLEGRIFHYNSSLTCIAAFYSSLLPNIAHGEFFKSLGFSHILNSSYLAV